MSNLVGSYRLSRHLACPAGFQPATYALDEFMATGMSVNFNDLHD